MEKQDQSVTKPQHQSPAYCSEKWFKNLLKESSILDKQGLQLLVQWMPWDVQKIVFKFKASSHEFRMFKFYEICGGLQNLIVVAKTTHGKILGGFTPLSFYPARGEWEYEQDWVQKLKDESNASFIFSLSERQKFDLIQDQVAIIRWRDKRSIIFYGSFGLGDQAQYYNYNNILTLSNQQYDTSKYPKCQQSFQKLIGQKTNSFQFLTTQWQVYQVQWK